MTAPTGRASFFDSEKKLRAANDGVQARRRWADFDMVRGRLRVFRKGQNWFYFPLAPDVVDVLRASFRCHRDVAALRPLLGHSRIDPTQVYTDEIELDELAIALARALLEREAQASPDLATLAEQTLKYPRNRLMEATGSTTPKFGSTGPTCGTPASHLRPLS